jgi:uncharacterized protein YlzI (FlbEa/FlbD family)
MKLIKIKGFGKEYYINPEHIVSVYESSVKTISRSIDDFDFIPCVSIQTVTEESFSCDEKMESILAKIEEVKK